MSNLLNETIDKMGFREDMTFQAGWSTGRLDLVRQLLEAKSGEELEAVVTAAAEESRQIALDGITAILSGYNVEIEEDDSE